MNGGPIAPGLISTSMGDSLDDRPRPMKSSQDERYFRHNSPMQGPLPPPGTTEISPDQQSQAHTTYHAHGLPRTSSTATVGRRHVVLDVSSLGFLSGAGGSTSSSLVSGTANQTESPQWAAASHQHPPSGQGMIMDSTAAATATAALPQRSLSDTTAANGSRSIVAKFGGLGWIRPTRQSTL